MRERLLRILTEKFSPTSLDVVDDSHLHAGHLPGSLSQGTHFTVTVVSSVFEGKTRVERHRMVYAALAEPLNEGVHALKIRALSPSESK